MQDNAPALIVCLTLAYLNANCVDSISWPALSSYLNLTKNFWSVMKVFIQALFPEFEREKQRNRYDVSRIVQEVWYNFATEDQLTELFKTIPKRLKDVLDVDGGLISY